MPMLGIIQLTSLIFMDCMGMLFLATGIGGVHMGEVATSVL